MPQRSISSKIIHWAIAVAFSLTILFIIDRLTNSVIELPWAAWDFNHYILMAERGVTKNPDLVAPYAYRPLTPLMAGWLMRTLGYSAWRAFKLIAWMGAALNLLTLFWLLKRNGYSLVTCLWVLGIIALAQFQVKFLFFDPFRPDHLAFPLINLAYIALWADLFLPAALCISIGLLAREFLLVPVGSFLLAVWRDKSKWMPAAMITLTGGLVLVMTRRLILVSGHEDYLNSSSIAKLALSLISIPLDWRRTLNLLFCVLAYLLPLGVLFTPGRFWQMWMDLSARRMWLIGHVVITLLLALYGGTDLARFIVYLSLPLALVMAEVLEKGQISASEKVLMVISLFIFNRIPWPYPTSSPGAYLDFYAGYHDRLNLASLMRWGELICWLVAGAALRAWLSQINPTKLNEK